MQQETVARRLHYVHQEGAQVFKYAVNKMQEYSRAILDRNGFSRVELTDFWMRDMRFLLRHMRAKARTPIGYSVPEALAGAGKAPSG